MHVKSILCIVVVGMLATMQGCEGSSDHSDHTCPEIVDVESDSKQKNALVTLSFEWCVGTEFRERFMIAYEKGQYNVTFGNRTASCTANPNGDSVLLRCRVPPPAWRSNRWGYVVAVELRDINDLVPVSIFEDAFRYGPPIETRMNVTNTTDPKERCLLAVSWDSFGFSEYIAVTHRMLRILPEEWRFYVQVSNASRRRYLKDRFVAESVRSGRLELDPNLDEYTRITDYSKAQLSLERWKSLPGDVILTYQGDSILCSRSIYNVKDFIDYDLIGAVWFHMKEEPGRNSGLSIRSRAAMVDALTAFNSEVTRYNLLSDGYREDVYSGRLLAQRGASIAPWDISQRFSVEDLRAWNHGCLGFHKPPFPVSRFRWAAVLDWCPEVLLILPQSQLRSSIELFGADKVAEILEILKE